MSITGTQKSQSTARKFHHAMLLMILLPLGVMTLISAGLILAVVAIGFGRGYEAVDFAAIAFLLIPVFFTVWGCRLFFPLYQGIHAKIRTRLLRFYCWIWCYCMVLMFGFVMLTKQHDPWKIAKEALFFGLPAALPAFAVLLTKPEEDPPESPPVNVSDL